VKDFALYVAKLKAQSAGDANSITSIKDVD
jgi:hypothetical protein